MRLLRREYYIYCAGQCYLLLPVVLIVRRRMHISVQVLHLRWIARFRIRARTAYHRPWSIGWIVARLQEMINHLSISPMLSPSPVLGLVALACRPGL